MRNEGPQSSRRGQLQTGRIAPVLEFIGQQFHGHSFILLEGLLQHIQGELAELSVMTQRWAAKKKCRSESQKHFKRLAMSLSKKQYQRMNNNIRLRLQKPFQSGCSSGNGRSPFAGGFTPQYTEFGLHQEWLSYLPMGRSLSTPQNRLHIAWFGTPWQDQVENFYKEKTIQYWIRN